MTMLQDRYWLFRSRTTLARWILEAASLIADLIAPWLKKRPVSEAALADFPPQPGYE